MAVHNQYDLEGNKLNLWVVTDIKTLSDRLGLTPLTYNIDIDAKVDVFNNYYLSQYSPNYVVGLRNSSKILGGGERIYLWSKANYHKGLVNLSGYLNKKSVK